MAKIHLRHPEWEGLVFGDGPDAIKFGLRGGFKPGDAYVDEDHPLLPALLERHPAILIVQPDAGPAKTWLCPIHLDREFKTRSALISHLRAGDHPAEFAAIAAEAEAKEASEAAEPVAAGG